MKKASAKTKKVKSPAHVTKELHPQRVFRAATHKERTGDKRDMLLTKTLKRHFQDSSMNICQTKKLSMMAVPKMRVELKDSTKNKAPIKTTRIIPVPLPLREQTRRDLNNAVQTKRPPLKYYAALRIGAL